MQEECEGSSSIASSERSNNDDDSLANSKSPMVDGGAPKPRKLFKASSRSWCVTPSNSVRRDNFLEEEENEDTFNPNFSRDGGATSRKRIKMENAELSRQFSNVLSEFLNRPSISSRRKFPLRRCEKIIVQSILSFEWIHSEVTAAGSYLRCGRF
jgi:hypothetical protein